MVKFNENDKVVVVNTVGSSNLVLGDAGKVILIRGEHHVDVNFDSGMCCCVPNNCLEKKTKLNESDVEYCKNYYNNWTDMRDALQAYKSFEEDQLNWMDDRTVERILKILKVEDDPTCELFSVIADGFIIGLKFEVVVGRLEELIEELDEIDKAEKKIVRYIDLVTDKMLVNEGIDREQVIDRKCPSDFGLKNSPICGSINLDKCIDSCWKRIVEESE